MKKFALFAAAAAPVLFSGCASIDYDKMSVAEETNSRCQAALSMKAMAPALPGMTAFGAGNRVTEDCGRHLLITLERRAKAAESKKEGAQ